MRGGPPQPLDEALAAAGVLERAREVTGAPPAPASSPSAPPGPEPAPNSPEDVGFVPPPAAPDTHACKSCGARIYWVQLVDEHGSRQRRDDGKGWKAMPVDAQPDPVKGNVLCWRTRDVGRTLYGRVLRRGDPIPPGARLRTSHFATCPNAQHHRRTRRG